MPNHHQIHLTVLRASGALQTNTKPLTYYGSPQHLRDLCARLDLDPDHLDLTDPSVVKELRRAYIVGNDKQCNPLFEGDLDLLSQLLLPAT